MMARKWTIIRLLQRLQSQAPQLKKVSSKETSQTHRQIENEQHIITNQKRSI